MKHRTAGAVIICVITCVIWGFSFMFTRNVVVRINFLSLLSWRFLIAFIAFSILLVCGVFQINLKGKKLWPLVYIAIAEPIIFFTFESMGLYLTSTTESSLMIATIPNSSHDCRDSIAKQIPTKKTGRWLLYSP